MSETNGLIIKTVGNRYQVILNGQNISRFVTKLTLRFEVDHLTTAEMTLIPDPLEIPEELQVIVNATRQGEET